MSESALRRCDLPTDTIALARFLLDMCLFTICRKAASAGAFVETEAYVLDDASFMPIAGKPRVTRRCSWNADTRTVFYLRFIVLRERERAAKTPAVGAAVLLRALEPLEGISVMERLRKTTVLRDLARGPGRLAQALGVHRAHDGVDLCEGGPLRLERGAGAPDVRVEKVRASA